jgi:hypothetical protein
VPVRRSVRNGRVANNAAPESLSLRSPTPTCRPHALDRNATRFPGAIHESAHGFSGRRRNDRIIREPGLGRCNASRTPSAVRRRFSLITRFATSPVSVAGKAVSKASRWRTKVQEANERQRPIAIGRR